MAVQVMWQPNINGACELWLVEGGTPSCRLLAVGPERMATVRPLVQRWADQADSVPEFLEMMHLEDLIDMETLRRLLTDQVPLYRVWARLREFWPRGG
jgi:hypothetical protein